MFLSQIEALSKSYEIDGFDIRLPCVTIGKMSPH